MKSQKRRKADDPHSQKTEAVKSENKYIFNISSDSLKCFIKHNNGVRTERKRAINRYGHGYSDQKRVESNEDDEGGESLLNKSYSEDVTFTELNANKLSYSESMRKMYSSPDLAREASNLIIKKIENNGIHFEWKQIEQSKSECDEEEWSSNTVWHPVSQQHQVSQQYQASQQQHLGQQYPTSQHFDENSMKSASFASTMDHYSPGQFYNYKQSYVQNVIYYQNQCNVEGVEMSRMNNNGYYDPCMFKISIQNINVDERTTLMIKNIPNKYTIKHLSEEIDASHANTYDFLYLPCDIKNNCNVGYGFINFIHTDMLKQFYADFHGNKWLRFRSQKICNLTYARLQGLSSLIQHFQNSKVLNHKDKKYQPIIRERAKIENLIKIQQSNLHSKS